MEVAHVRATGSTVVHANTWRLIHLLRLAFLRLGLWNFPSSQERRQKQQQRQHRQQQDLRYRRRQRRRQQQVRFHPRH